MMFFVGAFLTLLFVFWLVPPDEFPQRLKLGANVYAMYVMVELLAGVMF